MTKQIIKESKKRQFTVTEFCSSKGKISYQITQKYKDIDYNYKDETRHSWGYVQLSKKELIYILDKIKMR